jgi:hypothetical protein
MEDKKKQKAICEYAIRCRKMQVSMMYLTQSWFDTPDVIRKNVNMLVLKKIPKTSDLGRILKDYSLGLNKDEILQLYNFAVRGKTPRDKSHYFLIDLNEDDDSPYKYRRDLNPIKWGYE